MPVVPYKPIPSVTPTEAGPRGFSLSTPGEAFGTNIGQAIQRLGSTVEKAGNELTDRAIAFQELKNQSENADLQSQLDIAIGQKHAQFSAKAGKDAVDSFPGYMQELEQTRKQMSEGIENPAVKRMFDIQSKNVVARTIFNGAGHAGQQQKVWSINSANSRVQAQQDQARYLTEDNVFNEGLKHIAERATEAGELAGMDADQIAQKVFREQSVAHTNRIDGIARTDPPRARKLLDEAIKNHSLHSEDLDRTEKIVRGEMRNTGARQVANSVMDEAKSHQDFFSERLENKNVHVDGMHPVFADRLHSALVDAEKATGNRAQVESLTRSTEEQARIFREHQRMPGGVAAHPAAPPGTSRHELGQAADIKDGPVLDWLHQHAKEYGLEFLGGRTGKNDPGHIQLSEGTPSVPSKPFEPSEANIRDRARAKAEKLDPNDTVFHDMAADRAVGDYRKMIQDKKDDNYRNMNTINGAILARHPRTLDQLRADPDASKAYDNLDETHQLRVTKSLERVGKAVSDLRTVDRLMGLRTEHPDQFVDEDIMNNKDLSDADKRKFIGYQNEVKKGATGDPRVNSAMQILEREQIVPPDVVRDKKSDEYLRLKGGLGRMIEDFQENKKKKPEPDDVRAMGRQLILDQEVPGRFGGIFGAGHAPVYSERAFEASKEAITKILKDKGIPNPSEDDVIKTYYLWQYNKLFGKKEK